MWHSRAWTVQGEALSGLLVESDPQSARGSRGQQWALRWYTLSISAEKQRNEHILFKIAPAAATLSLDLIAVTQIEPPVADEHFWKKDGTSSILTPLTTFFYLVCQHAGSADIKLVLLLYVQLTPHGLSGATLLHRGLYPSLDPDDSSTV